MTAFLLAEEPAMSMTTFLVCTVVYAVLGILAGCWIVALMLEHGQERDEEERRADLDAASRGRR